MVSQAKISSTAILIFFLCVLVLASPSPAQNSQSMTGESGSYVTVQKVIKYKTADGRSYFFLSYTFNFPQLQSVYVTNLGTVPNPGSYNYFTSDTSLEFRASADGPLLSKLPLAESVTFASGTPTVEIPKETQFPQEGHNYPLESNKPFQPIVESVLNQCCRYFSYIAQGSSTTITTFAPLQVPNTAHGARFHIALMLKWPASSANTFQVRSIVEEGRIGSSEWRTADREQLHAADVNFEELWVNQLLAAGRAR